MSDRLLSPRPLQILGSWIGDDKMPVLRSNECFKGTDDFRQCVLQNLKIPYRLNIGRLGENKRLPGAAARGRKLEVRGQN